MINTLLINIIINPKHFSYEKNLIKYWCGNYHTYGAQNEAYMCRSAEKWVRGLCFNELGVSG